MKGATLKATLEHLGVLAPYSRPGVSDDNPFVESLFGTMKTRVGYPKHPFSTLEQAQVWVDAFVRWYNEVHRHSALNWVRRWPVTADKSVSCCVVARRRTAGRASAIRNAGPVTSETAHQRRLLNPKRNAQRKKDGVANVA